MDGEENEEAREKSVLEAAAAETAGMKIAEIGEDRHGRLVDELGAGRRGAPVVGRWRAEERERWMSGRF